MDFELRSFPQDGWEEKIDLQSLPGTFKNSPENEVLVEVSFLAGKQFGPILLSVEGDEGDDPQNVCRGSFPDVVALVREGVDAQLLRGRFTMPKLSDRHIVVVMPPEKAGDDAQGPSFQQIVYAVEVGQRAMTLDEICRALREDFGNRSCPRVAELCVYDPKRLDNLPEAFCAGSIFTGMVQSDECSIPRQTKPDPDNFTTVEAQPTSPTTHIIHPSSVTVPSSSLLGTGSGSLMRRAQVAETSRLQTTEHAIAPFKHDCTQQDVSRVSDSEVPVSPPNLSVVGMVIPAQTIPEGGNSLASGTGGNRSEDGSGRGELTRSPGPADPPPILPPSSNREGSDRPGLVPVQEGGGGPRPGNEEEAQVDAVGYSSRETRLDSVADGRCVCLPPSPVVGIDQGIPDLGAKKERVVPYMWLPSLGEALADMVVPHVVMAPSRSLERGHNGIKDVQEISNDNPELAVVRALEHASNGFCSYCRLENHDKCRIVLSHRPLIERQSFLLSLIGKMSASESEELKATIRDHALCCRDHNCEVPHKYAGCRSPGIPSSSSVAFCSPISSQGDRSKEVFVPPPVRSPPQWPTSSRRCVNRNVMVIDGTESDEQRGPAEVDRRIEFPDSIARRPHGDLVYIREGMHYLDGWFKYIPPIKDIHRQDILGEGGNGTVFKRPFQGIQYALKLTSYRKTENEIWSKLRSENVTSLLAVAVYDPIGAASKPSCLQVMPVMSGTLHSHLKLIGGSISAARNEPHLWHILKNTWVVLSQVLEGLDYLARNRIYYCDLKTSNVLVDRRCACNCVFRCEHHDNWSLRPCLKLGDFDSARTFQTANTEAYTTYRDFAMVMKSPEKCAKELGTVGNRAPEQFLCSSPVINPVYARSLMDGLVGHWSDIWSFGILIIRIFLGRTPRRIHKEAWGFQLQPCRRDMDKKCPQHEIFCAVLMLKDFGLCDDEPDFRKAAKIANNCLQADYRERPSAHRLLEILALLK